MSSLKWFRAYSNIVDDDKLRLLAFEDRWHFVALCALKCSGLLDEQNSQLRSRKIAVKLGVQVRELEEIARRLQEVGLIDETLNPASWDRLQFKGDSSNERVKRYRETRKAKGLQAQWQPTKELRQAIYDRDGYACVYCQAKDDLTLDHKTPEIRGGGHTLDNLQTACRPCNAQKRDLTHEEYLVRRAGNGGVTLQKRPQRTETDSERSSSNEDVSVSTDPPVSKSEILEAWEARMVPLGFPAVRKMTSQRERQLRARLRDSKLEDWMRAFDALERSPFLRGENDRGWRADFDFLLQPKSFTKLIEGAYDH